MKASVVDNVEKNRFEMNLPDGLAFVAYQRTGNVLSLNHAEVPFALQGQGLGAELARGTLMAIRAEGGTVIPRCSFIAAFMRRHPEFNDLLAH